MCGIRFSFVHKGARLGFIQAPLGGAACAGVVEELLCKGAKRFLFVGSCGSLDAKVTSGHLLVTTAAYRDEGVSYHYAPPGDYIDVPTAQRLSQVLEELHVPHTRVKTWTTDTFYRETRRNMEARRAEGCAAVEMECASIMAVAQFRGAQVYQLLYTADCLDGEDWDQRILGSMPEDLSRRNLTVAVETAVRLDA